MESSTHLMERQHMKRERLVWVALVLATLTMGTLMVMAM